MDMNQKEKNICGLFAETNLEPEFIKMMLRNCGGDLEKATRLLLEMNPEQKVPPPQPLPRQQPTPQFRWCGKCQGQFAIPPTLAPGNVQVYCPLCRAINVVQVMPPVVAPLVQHVQQPRKVVLSRVPEQKQPVQQQAIQQQIYPQQINSQPRRVVQLTRSSSQQQVVPQQVMNPHRAENLRNYYQQQNVQNQWTQMQQPQMVAVPIQAPPQKQEVVIKPMSNEEQNSASNVFKTLLFGGNYVHEQHRKRMVAEAQAAGLTVKQSQPHPNVQVITPEQARQLLQQQQNQQYQQHQQMVAVPMQNHPQLNAQQYNPQQQMVAVPMQNHPQLQQYNPQQQMGPGLQQVEQLRQLQQEAHAKQAREAEEAFIRDTGMALQQSIALAKQKNEEEQQKRRAEEEIRVRQLEAQKAAMERQRQMAILERQAEVIAQQQAAETARLEREQQAKLLQEREQREDAVNQKMEAAKLAKENAQAGMRANLLDGELEAQLANLNLNMEQLEPYTAPMRNAWGVPENEVQIEGQVAPQYTPVTQPLQLSPALAPSNPAYQQMNDVGSSYVQLSDPGQADQSAYNSLLPSLLRAAPAVPTHTPTAAQNFSQAELEQSNRELNESLLVIN
jgi:hypothetical protein